MTWSTIIKLHLLVIAWGFGTLIVFLVALKFALFIAWLMGLAPAYSIIR